MLYDGKFHCFAFEPKFFLSLLCSYKNNMILNFFNVLLFSQSSILASDLYNLLEACWPRYFWIFAPTSVITKGKALLQTGWIIRIFEEGNPSGSDNLGTRGPSETKPLDVYFLNLYVNPFAISPRISKWKVKPCSRLKSCNIGYWVYLAGLIRNSCEVKSFFLQTEGGYIQEQLYYSGQKLQFWGWASWVQFFTRSLWPNQWHNFK